MEPVKNQLEDSASEIAQMAESLKELESSNIELNKLVREIPADAKNKLTTLESKLNQLQTELNLLKNQDDL